MFFAQLALKMLLLAFLEEIIKYYIVKLSLSAKYPIVGLLFFATFEALVQFPEILQHISSFGVQNESISFILTITVIFLVKPFHVATSYIYMKSRSLLLPIAYCTVWHTIYNITVYFLPEFSLPTYISTSALILIINIIILFLYFKIERMINDAKIRKQ